MGQKAQHINVYPFNMIWCDAKNLETERSEPLNLRLIGVEAKQGESGELVDALLCIQREIFRKKH